MKSLNKRSFKLPFMGKDIFLRLVRMGLGYDNGSFYIKDYNNVEKTIDFLSGVLHEKISFLQECILCGKDFFCSDCKYQISCPTKDLPLQCICKNCLKNPELYDIYVSKNLS